ncbi:zinc-binding dehydrogenase [Dactylosporangium sp. NPDC005555]|uniref:zinc-binding dehydrogenase n=1 Tax=Dactylosporangium sp. NPDC005555 TaxID=3154889 RepID=UPI0033B1CCF6
MRALVTTGGADPVVAFAEVVEPDPAPGEAVVAVSAAGLNRGELTVAAAVPAGSRLGWDVAGVVERAAADGSGPAGGTRVLGLAGRDGFAERVAVPTGHLAVLPDTVPDTAGAALPVAGLTALYALRHAGWLLGRTVLVTGAGGGVGRVVVQLAAAAGARVLAQVGGAGRGDGLEKLGASVVGQYGDDLAEPVDVLLDSVGGSTLELAFQAVAADGVVVSFGNTTREPLRLPLDWGRLRPGVSLRSLYLFQETRRQPVGRDLVTLAGLVAQGRLDPQVALTAPFASSGPAWQALRDRQVNGKVVLTL